jgi:twitching motility protein PilT
MSIKELLIRANHAGASDVHLSIDSLPVFRIHGRLSEHAGQRIMREDMERWTKELLTEDQYARFHSLGELDFSYSLDDTVRFRVNIYKKRIGISIALRLIPTQIPGISALNIDPVVLSMVTKPQGLFLVTGPTGSGKTTTIASLINHMNQHQNRHIITLEDPIEYIHKNRTCLIDQREVGEDTATFASGLRASLRQDPDVIVVGEMRDLETIQTALTAAETGHLVMATLHTTDAPQTIDRIIDVFPPNQQHQIRTQLAGVLNGILSQRLIPTADQQGRAAVSEILINNTAVANLIRTEKVHQIHGLLQTSHHLGMRTLNASIRDRLNQGLFSLDTVKELGLWEDDVNY